MTQPLCHINCDNQCCMTLNSSNSSQYSAVVHSMPTKHRAMMYRIRVNPPGTMAPRLPIPHLAGQRCSGWADAKRKPRRLLRPPRALGREVYPRSSASRGLLQLTPTPQSRLLSQLHAGRRASASAANAHAYPQRLQGVRGLQVKCLQDD